MRVTNIFFAALLAFSELDLAAAKALMHVSRPLRRRNHLEDMRKTTLDVAESQIVRREPQSSSTAVLTPVSESADMNTTIAASCATALAKLHGASNDAGMMACYNVLQFDSNANMFQADLRLYQPTKPTGAFAEVDITNMLIGLTFPTSTTFNSLTRKAKRSSEKRQSGSAEIQQYSLLGTITKTMELNKLNETEIMSLMVPTITISAANPPSGKPASVSLTAADTVHFVVGQFKGQFTSAAVDPAIQAAAIAQSSAFVLPGTTFGIFPIGFIVTSSWLALFALAYGLGTLGRIRHRTFYRKRTAASLGRTGKRI